MKSTKFKPAMVVYAIFALLMAIQPRAFAALDTSDTTSNLCDLFKRGIFCMKLVVIFLPSNILFSFIKNTEVKISAFGNISSK